MKGLSRLQASNLDHEELKELLSNIELMSSAEFGRLIGWTTKKISVYCSRGKLPEPIAYIGGRPVWTKEQIESFIKQGRF